MNRRLCLLVDDDEEDHEIFTYALVQTDPYLDYITVASGSAAIEKLGNDQDLTPDIIFLDLNMPVKDGRQTLVELRQIDRLQRVPIIILSTSDSEQDVHDTRSLGSKGYVVKPDSIAKLIKTLEKVFESLSAGEDYFFYPRNPYKRL